MPVIESSNCASLDDSGIAIEDADSEERDTDHDSKDQTDCEERV